MLDFANKIVWITGASSGIGEALTYEFAKRNCKLILSARRLPELERVKKNCVGNPENIFILPFDLSDASALKDIAREAVKAFGGIDVLVNNGGVSQRSWANATPLEIDRKLMEINYFSTIALTKSVLPYMMLQKSGYIIAMSSVAGTYGFFLRSAYAASKHALHGFFESLRFELMPYSIDVSLICPGKIKTNISLNALTETGDKFGKMDASTEQGISAETCAKKIIKGLEKKKETIFIGGKEILPVYIKRFFPKLFTWIMQRQKIE
jgi:short-subunit dehydrogenase